MTSSRETVDLAFLPIHHDVLHKHYKELCAMFWTPEEIDYSKDRDDWNSLDEDTRFYVKQLLFLFSQLDGVINENLLGNFVEETSFLKDAAHFYAIQVANETIHNETYSVLIDTFITNLEEKSKGLDSIRNYPMIKAIGDWAYKWMNKEIPLVQRILAFACIEGVIFSSAFAGIYYIKRRFNKLQGLLKANEWIARDEGLHTQFAVDLYHIIKTHPDLSEHNKQITQEQAYEIVKSAVEVCENFTRTSMNVHLIGLNADEMVGYVETTADWVLHSFGFDKLYNTVNPLDWTATIAFTGKTNFFEGKVTEYARPIRLNDEVVGDDEDVYF
jgi:ribonucleoside-diphosphate reductase subunit M2